MALISSLFLMFLISSFNPNTYHLYSITYPLVLGYSIALSRLTPESCLPEQHLKLPRNFYVARPAARRY